MGSSRSASATVVAHRASKERRSHLAHSRARAWCKTGKMATKRWPYFTELAAAFDDLVVVGTPADLRRNGGPAIKFPRHVRSLVGTLTLRNSGSYGRGGSRSGKRQRLEPYRGRRRHTDDHALRSNSTCLGVAGPRWEKPTNLQTTRDALPVDVAEAILRTG